MAGYREFQTGEVLTAANVDDFLAKQAVMKFADAAARNTALGTAVGGSNALREGMVAWLDDTDELLKYDGTAWATIGAAGIGSNVVQTVKNDAFTTNSISFVDVTSLTVTITPSTNTSKVLLIASVSVGHVGGQTFTVLTDSSNTPVIAVASGTQFGSDVAPTAGEMIRQDWSALVSPSTTSPVTYKIRARSSTASNAACINRRGSNSAFSYSTLTAIEVAA